MKAELPVNEILRIKALHDLAILDTPREQEFDDVAQLAMHICDVPIAVVSLVDNDRQWFKSCIGLDATETPRDVAFCAHAILVPDQVMVVEDATKDPRFVDNALVLGPPFIRFYAGAPLVDEQGNALGTLCVIDYKPRSITEIQINSLKSLARQVIQLLRLKSLHDAMQQHSRRLQFIADKVPVLIGELNRQERYVFANQKYSEWFGVDSTQLIGKKTEDIFPRDIVATINASIAASFQGHPVCTEVQLPSGRYIDINYVPHLEDGTVVGIYEVATDVTERKVHLEVLHEERERLDSIIEGTNTGTWEWNIQTGEALLNERWANIIGYKLHELKPTSFETWVKYSHPEDLEKSNQLLQKHFSGELPYYDCKVRMKHKNGHWVWIHDRGRVVSYDRAGKPLLMRGTHTDITDAQNLQIKINQNEQLLRSLLSNFPGVAYRRDNSKPVRIHYLSDAIQSLTGYTTMDLMGGGRRQNLGELVHPADKASVESRLATALAEKKSFAVEYRLLHADGRIRHVQELGAGVYDSDGELQFVDGFIWDVTERYETEREKRVLSSKMTSLYHMAPVAIILNRLSDGLFIDVNPEMVKMSGYSVEELRAMTYWDITPHHHVDEHQQIELLKANRRYGPFEKNYVHKKGHLITVLLNGVLIESESGEQQIWSIAQDITEQKRMERMKNEFISTVSHELRTPLTSISGALGLITSNMLGALPDKAKGMLDIAYKNSQRLTLLINDLLDMEKLLAGKMHFDMKVQSLAVLVEQVVTENKSYADKYAVHYVIQNRAANVYANVDGFRLQQVLNNFLSNAAKFSPKDSKVDVILENRDDLIRVSIKDYGEGIPDEFKARIFQKFSQADSSDSREKGGTGLGLAISKELIERMAGHIGFESTLGQGSCFFAEFYCVNHSES